MRHRRARPDGGGDEDRLSDLPDEVLGRILSCLPTKEAGRVAVLSRQYDDIFASVDTISLEEEDRNLDEWITFYYESEERRSMSGDFLDSVNGALHCRRRCTGLARNTSLRVFRVALQRYHFWDKPMVDQWVTHALQQSSKEEFHLDLRLHIHGDGDGDGDGDCDCSSQQNQNQNPGGGGGAESGCDDEKPGWNAWRHKRLPRRLFWCAGLRSLRVGYCKLKPPEVIRLPSLETLHLTGVPQSGRTIQRLISSCPRLADLTLELCAAVKRLSVLDKRLRRLSLRCCHNVASVAIDASELVTLDYRGVVPAESLLTLRGSPRIISSCTICICGPRLSTTEELVGLGKLLENLVGARHLRLASRRMGCSIESKSLARCPAFPNLRRLELTGCVERCNAVVAVTRILEQAPNVEALTLLLKPVEDDLEDDAVQIARATDPSLQCLWRVREMNLVQYRGDEAQRRTAEVLLANAVALQNLCVVFAEGWSAKQTSSLMNEIKGWAVNKEARMTFQ